MAHPFTPLLPFSGTATKKNLNFFSFILFNFGFISSASLIRLSDKECYVKNCPQKNMISWSPCYCDQNYPDSDSDYGPNSDDGYWIRITDPDYGSELGFITNRSMMGWRLTKIYYVYSNADNFSRDILSDNRISGLFRFN